MDDMPDELLLQIFDELSFNDIRPALATCARWRTLAQRSRAFWADIQTPRTSTGSRADEDSREAAYQLACRRITATNEAGFTLRLYGTVPTILAAAVDHIGHVEHLDVLLSESDDTVGFFEVLRTVTAPRIRALSIRLHPTGSETLYTLPGDLFRGTVCPMLTRVSLSEVLLPASGHLRCFAAVQDVRYWHSDNLVAPSAPDVFMHFPAMRWVSLSGHVKEIAGHRAEQAVLLRRLRTADFSRLASIHLRDECWELAENCDWPLEPVPHVTVDWTSLKVFPYVSSELRGQHELVFEPPAGVRTESLIRVGNDDWTWSRGCTAKVIIAHFLDGMSFFSAPTLEFGIEEQIAGAICTASLPAPFWSIAISLLNDARELRTLRLVLGTGSDALPMPRANERRPRLRCAQLNTLILRGPARVEYDHILQFASGALPQGVLPLRLALEDVELSGSPSDKFAAYFSDIQIEDPSVWSYLSVRDMLNKNDYWRVCSRMLMTAITNRLTTWPHL